MSKYQFSIWAIILALIIPGVTQAAYNDAALEVDTIINTGGYNLTVSGSTASLASITVDTSSFEVSVNRGSTITIQSADRKVMTVSGITDSYVTQTCTGSASAVAITIPQSASGADQIVTITPTSSTCSALSGSVSSGGGGGGGGPPAPVTTPVIIPAVATIVPGCPVGYTCKAAVTLPTQASVQAIASVSKVFTKRLVQGNTNSDVKRLQTLLASDPSVYPTGQITGYFGPLTRKAVENFQVKHKIAAPGAEGFGTVGPMTRAALLKVFGN